MTATAAAQEPFRALLNLDFDPTPIEIPPGKTLLADQITLSGIAFSADGPVQPVLILHIATAQGETSQYVRLSQPAGSRLQFECCERVHVRADRLTLEAAYSGSTPTCFRFHVAVHGRLEPLAWGEPKDHC